MIRRLAGLAALVGVAFAGLASAWVVARPAAGSPPAKNEVTICHATSSATNPYVVETPAADAILSGHEYLDDIIPPFVVVINGTTVTFPGRNMDKVFGSGIRGADVLANGCRVPTGNISATTVPGSIIEPGRTITTPPITTVETTTETVGVPATTATVPVATTVVTVPPDSTTTVALPEQTVTLPPSTETVNGEHVVRPPDTVTLPGTTQTETAGATATDVTVTAPDKVVQGGDHATKEVVVTVTTPGQTTTEPPRTVPVIEHHVTGQTVTETVPTSTTQPATTVTVPGITTTETRTETVGVPATTVTVPADSIVATVPAGSTTTVALPARIVTVPASTVTTKGEAVERPAEVVTIPATTRTVTGDTMSTVVTVTGPDTVVEGEIAAAKRAVVTVTTASQIVREPARVVHTDEREILVVDIDPKGCPTGTMAVHGICARVGRGRG